MSFYAALIDLLGRCAPEMHVSLGQPSWVRQGRGLEMLTQVEVMDLSPYG